MTLFGFTFGWVLLGLAFSLFVVGLTAFAALLYRRVVSTNEVHIVQSSKKTISYGKDTGNGNTYYEWPAWVPKFGIIKAVMPVSVFDVVLSGYEAYDLGRLPFVVDVVAFFRITDSNIAAQRVASFDELLEQLKSILQGAVRTILASNDIESIMQGRSKFGEAFTTEVESQLAQWGVGTVKNIELMDIRDHKESQVIRNIMEKKKSHIEMESRQEVAKNHKLAEIAEIDAKQSIELQKQGSAQAVGLRTVEANRQVSIANQEMTQVLADQKKTTTEKEMAVLKVQEVRKADIEREVNVVKALQSKETTTIVAEGQLEAKKRTAEGITVEGEARANAERAMQLAPVQAQITLAKEIGDNEGYQKYLITIRQVEAAQAVGVESAKALNNAEIKVISNSDNAATGLNKVMDLFSTTGGLKVGSLLEGLAQTDAGKDLLEKVTGKSGKAA